ncbi:AAA family ATPase [Bacillus toyonensis]|uniref:AAA family ATPase n=1 Tax=Bacillus toyonensis TaxID=155322 RepID=UPI000BF6BC09|nr:AAA family ATPase [Bacillus toyonensis]PGB61577.1 ATP-binding protein [Bacillus toyonensis]
MLFKDFKLQLDVDEESFIEIVKKFGFEGLTEIDDALANDIINRMNIKKKFKNESSLKGIKIQGLFKKYDYEIAFDENINIFVAENGHGKTTIIKIIVAALNGDAVTLNKLPFEKIELDFGNKNVVSIKRLKNSTNIADMECYYQKAIDLEELVQRRNLPKALRNIVVHSGTGMIPEEEIRMYLRAMRNSSNVDIEEIKNANKYLNRIKDSYIKSYKKIEEHLKEKVKYLPTFRRVEAELREIYTEDVEFEGKFEEGSMKFGLKDVELRINRLTNRLTKEAFETHSKINGEILGDLLSDSPLKISENQRKEITIEKMQIIIGRIGKENIKEYDKLIDFLSTIDENEYSNNNEFLEYYIYKLIKIFDGQREIDNKIKEFKDVCNKYLINKELEYDEVSPKMQIIDKEDRNPISFSELSSGEKQILSIFSELYLEDTKPLIYIIDEPELSLSIAWQKKILKDIYDSGKVALMISTTHSPFIFKNELEVFAKDLNKFKTKTYSNSNKGK